MTLLGGRVTPSDELDGISSISFATRLSTPCPCIRCRRDTPWLSARRGHRAIGVVYDPSVDRSGNWVPTTMGRRYDAFCYFESTDALHPLGVEPATGGERETCPVDGMMPPRNRSTNQ